ncbi:13383_t:CDS:2, partial [Dentiscutata heterogama]
SGSTHLNANALSRINGAEEKIAEVYMVEENRKQTPEEATADKKELNKTEWISDKDEDYQELLEQLVLESGHILTWMSVELPKWEEPDKGVDYSDDEEWDNENIKTWWQPEEDCMGNQEWRNNWYEDAEEYEVFMIKVENGDSEEETIKSELEDYSPALRFFNNEVPGLGLLTSPFFNSEESTERRFVIEEYQRKLEYRESDLEALESDDESTQSRDVVILSEIVTENCKENTNPETDKEGDDEFWYSYDDDKT